MNRCPGSNHAIDRPRDVSGAECPECGFVIGIVHVDDGCPMFVGHDLPAYLVEGDDYRKVYELGGLWEGDEYAESMTYALFPNHLPVGGWLAQGAEREEVRVMYVLKTGYAFRSAVNNSEIKIAEELS